MVVVGKLNSTPGQEYKVELFANEVCDDSYGNGEGELFLDSAMARTDADGNVDFSFILPPGFSILTATATDPSGNTSEFSKCLSLSLCGNGAVDPGEDCDGGDCCSAECTFAEEGMICGDGDPCVPQSCNAHGACVNDIPPDCDDHNSCTEDRCEPSSG